MNCTVLFFLCATLVIGGRRNSRRGGFGSRERAGAGNDAAVDTVQPETWVDEDSSFGRGGRGRSRDAIGNDFNFDATRPGPSIDEDSTDVEFERSSGRDGQGRHRNGKANNAASFDATELATLNVGFPRDRDQDSSRDRGTGNEHDHRERERNDVSTSAEIESTELRREERVAELLENGQAELTPLEMREIVDGVETGDTIQEPGMKSKSSSLQIAAISLVSIASVLCVLSLFGTMFCQSHDCKIDSEIVTEEAVVEGGEKVFTDEEIVQVALEINDEAGLKAEV